jgi:hypothetical protein
MLLKKAGVEVITGSATLLSANEVKVGDATYESKNILLATGASPREVPSIPIDHQFVLSSRDALVMEELPEAMVVVGSGAIGSEFAFLYASLGVKVTVVEYMPQFMPLLDAEVSAAAERAFRRQRITVMTDTAVKGVSVADGKCVVEVEQKGVAKQIEADKVLSAVGIFLTFLPLLFSFASCVTELPSDVWQFVVGGATVALQVIVLPGILLLLVAVAVLFAVALFARFREKRRKNLTDREVVS